LRELAHVCGPVGVAWNSIFSGAPGENTPVADVKLGQKSIRAIETRVGDPFGARGFKFSFKVGCDISFRENIRT